MKVIILAGGLGSRLAEETEIKPKPMVEIGEYPILWHILRHYSYYGLHEFYVALGYKGEYVKRYFLDYTTLSGSISLNTGSGKILSHEHDAESWILHLIDTGALTMTGGRVKRLQDYIGDEPFMLTYGDGVSDVNISSVLNFHKEHKKLGTITAVRPPARFGLLDMEGDLVTAFSEKPQMGEGWINGGFMVLQPEVFDYIKDDTSVFEVEVLEKLASTNQLAAYKHDGFWQCMDTLKDKRYLDGLWKSGNAPWKH